MSKPTYLGFPDSLDHPERWPPNDCSLIDSGDTAWVLSSSALVFFMTPGLAFFYAGLIHRRSVITIMMQVFVSLGVTTAVWFLIGFSLAFGETSRSIIGNPSSYPFFLNLDVCTPVGYPMWPTTGRIPGLLFAGYQMLFAVITPAVIAGAFADRFRFGPFLLFLALWSLLVYCPFAHWVWSPNGYLFQWGVRDFAGGIVVHIAAGWSALGSVLFTGSRHFDSEHDRVIANTPHNRTFVALGVGILWFGWCGFNGGAGGAANGVEAFALTNSCISAGAGMLTWLAVEQHHTGKPSLVGACIGLVCGLATVGCSAGYIRPWAAFLVGSVAGPWCYAAIELRKAFKLDDALDVWGVHGAGGLLGSTLLGCLADEGINGMGRSGAFFGKQLCASVWTAFYSCAMTYLILTLINLVTPIIPTKDQLRAGLDVSLHNELAYDEDAVKHARGLPSSVECAPACKDGALEVIQVKADVGHPAADAAAPPPATMIVFQQTTPQTGCA